MAVLFLRVTHVPEFCDNFHTRLIAPVLEKLNSGWEREPGSLTARQQRPDMQICPHHTAAHLSSNGPPFKSSTPGGSFLGPPRFDLFCSLVCHCRLLNLGLTHSSPPGTLNSYSTSTGFCSRYAPIAHLEDTLSSTFQGSPQTSAPLGSFHNAHLPARWNSSLPATFGPLLGQQRFPTQTQPASPHVVSPPRRWAP